MNPKILCSKCSQEIRVGDKFCASCGVIIDWNAPPTKEANEPVPMLVKSQSAKSDPVQCPLCGHQNASGSSNCASCGAALPGAVKRTPADQKAPKKAPPTQPVPLSKFQNWKVTAGVALLVIIAVVVFKMTRPNDVPKAEPGLPPDAHQNQALMNELAALDKAVQANPDDPSTVLQYANHLQDAKFLKKAVEMYKHYLSLRPVDANATVDLGVTYYELANADTLTRVDDLNLAQTQFEAALKINPKHQLALFNLGVVNLMRGDMMTANDWFKKTIAIDSTSETGKRASNLVHQHSFTSSPSQ